MIYIYIYIHTENRGAGTGTGDRLAEGVEVHVVAGAQRRQHGVQDVVGRQQADVREAAAGA